jgi:hypothetical protein
MKELCEVLVLNVVFWLVSPVVAPAQLTFRTNNGAITITGYSGNPTIMVIPSATNGFPVVGIGNLAFSDCTSLISVSIPNSVTSIGEYAFEVCTSLTNVMIGAGVTNIGNAAFNSCPSLAAINVASSNSAFSSVSGVLYNQSQTVLVAYPNGGGTTYTIPNGVTNIGNAAFANSARLTSVTIPTSVTSMGTGEFEYCTSLTNVTIPNGVRSVETEAFYQCTNLASVTISASANDIGLGAFESCRGLKSVTIPNSVTNLENYAFEFCTGLTNLIIGTNVNAIGTGTFEYCVDLPGVTIPASVTNLGDAPFCCCYHLMAINVASGNPAFSSVAGVLYNQSLTTIVEYPAGGATAYTIPDGVTSIGSAAFESCTNVAGVTIADSVTNLEAAAFYDCDGLTRIAIPDSVTSIGAEAFELCTHLTCVTIGTNVSSIGTEAFDICPRLTRAYFDGNFTNAITAVFDGDYVTAYYLPGTTGWTEYSASSGVPIALWLPQVLTGDGNFGVRSNQFGFDLTWASGQTVMVDACTDLSNPVWQPVATNTLASGTAYFSDPQWANYPARFYRLRSP